jgi:hypothetical protein
MPAYDFADVMAEMGDFDSWAFKMALAPKNVDKKVCILEGFPTRILSLRSNFGGR